MERVLSIGITSYKRVKELERCIKSVDTKFIDDVEIIVSEDCSPLSKEIGEKVEELKKECPYKLEFMPNERNLGYDRNLGAIIKKSKGKYVCLMSDDDSFYEGFLDCLIPLLKKWKENYGVIYSPFVYTSNKVQDRYHGNSFIIKEGEESCSKYLYDSILFSGLIFNREYVACYDSSEFLNMNYFQVYLFLKMLYQYKGYYISHPSVWCISDGENAYGISDSSGGNEILADRNSVLSNLEFHKTLIKVIRKFDEEEGTLVFKSFEKQYSLHAYTGLSIARRCGKKYFDNYWRVLKSLDMHLYPVVKLFYFLLKYLGSNVSDKLTIIARKILKNDKRLK